jgi:hypothetical protein
VAVLEEELADAASTSTVTPDEDVASSQSQEDSKSGSSCPNSGSRRPSVLSSRTDSRRPSDDSSAVVDEEASYSHKLDSPRGQGQQVGQRPPARRLQELYKEHEKKQAKLKSQREQQAVEELAQIEKEKEKAKFTRRSSYADLNPLDAADRLYRDQERMHGRIQQKRLELNEAEKSKIEQSRFRASNGAALDTSIAGAMKASARLYSDALTRAEREQARATAQQEAAEEEAATRAGSQEVSPAARRARSAAASSRAEKLYHDAQQRGVRLERRREEVEKSEAKELAKLHQNLPAESMQIFDKLFKEASAWQAKRARDILEAKRREGEQLETIAPPKAPSSAGASNSAQNAPRAGRPLSFQPPARQQRSQSAGPCGARQAAGKQSSGRRVGSKPPAAVPPPEPASAQADCLLTAVVAALHSKSGGLFQPAPGDLKKLAAPLRQAVSVYRETEKACENSESSGFRSLCQMPSQRIFQARLVPEAFIQTRYTEPDHIRQVEERLDVLLQDAAQAHRLLRQRVAPDQEWSQPSDLCRPGAVPTALYACDPGPKARSQAETKAAVRFGAAEGPRRYRHLLDLARLTLVFANSEMLMAALEGILRQFEVVRVRNYFQTPGRLGARFLEILVTIEVQREGSQVKVPHVCELRLEVRSYQHAHAAVAPHLEDFESRLRAVCTSWPTVDVDEMMYLASSVLAGVPESHELRAFKIKLARSYGSPLGACRQLCSGRLLTFGRFREICEQVRCRERTFELWSELDAGLAGSVTAFELDPEGVSLLAHFRKRFCQHGKTDEDVKTQFCRMKQMAGAKQADRLQLSDFRNAGQALGFSAADCQRLFTCLDRRAVGSLGEAELGFLQRLDTLVHCGAILRAAPPAAEPMLAAAPAAAMAAETLLREAEELQGSEADDGDVF